MDAVARPLHVKNSAPCTPPVEAPNCPEDKMKLYTHYDAKLELDELAAVLMQTTYFQSTP